MSDLKIIALQAENLKRLVAVHIRPDGNLVQITGKNGEGKSSVLDAIWWALDGTANIQAQPIRKGADRATIRLDLGELIVTRTFKAQGDGGYTTAITVEGADGSRFSSPQKMLDGFLGALTFDPMEWLRMRPADQYTAMRAFVPGFDFDAFDRQQRGDYERRTDLGRQQREAEASARTILLPEGVRYEAVDEDALTAELARAGEHNASITERTHRRADVTEQVKVHRSEAEQLRKRAEDHEAQAAELQRKIDGAAALPNPIDTDALRAKITAARATNAQVRMQENKATHESRASALAAQCNELTENIAARERAKAEAVAKATLPIEGLTFGDGVVLFKGLPLDQASDAERLRVSVAIAMASNPKLKVVRIRDGSLLDEDGIELVAAMAAERGYQVWLERVDSSGTVGFVLEDGMVKGAPVPEPIATAAHGSVPTTTRSTSAKLREAQGADPDGTGRRP